MPGTFYVCRRVEDTKSMTTTYRVPEPTETVEPTGSDPPAVGTTAPVAREVRGIPLRDVAIALNAADRIWRPTVCRLAEELPRWIPAASSGAAAGPRLAHELGVPVRQLRRALELLPEAGAIAAREVADAEDLDAAVVTRFDPGYPPALLDLALPPPVLYHRGPLPAMLGTREGPAVAMVGTRKADPEGREIAELFARTLADAGVAVVSGFARGIDAAAHKGAVGSGRGPTVAVLGCGLAVSYPRGHRPLRHRILETGGALVSEWRCGTLPRPWRFPVRNRVIAALAQITLVVQAAPRSGSLITARHAMELGRDVWAVPGRIFDEKALGTNALIRDGAYPALHPRDLLEALRVVPGRKPSRTGEAPAPVPLPGEEEELPPGLAGRLLEALPPGLSRSADDLAVELEVPVDRLLSELLELELTGRVRRIPGPEYRRER
jgi:DNA processing protein